MPRRPPPLAAWKGPSEGRLSRVLSENLAVLWRFLRRLGVSDGDTDDAVQEVVLVLARKLDHVEVGRERSFVLGTALRVAAGFRRTRRNRREVDGADFSDLESPQLDPEALAERRRFFALCERVLSELPAELRVVFVLYELEELTMAKIATTLDLPPGTVASRLRRSREQFESLAASAARNFS